ncbi:MAG: rhomboid family intramembrane serine protease [candidate division WOR-3 bacterium]|nr:MAG: rhomboid family intramembrane serine protease [candidate division WOR-3 bacterium]
MFFIIPVGSEEGVRRLPYVTIGLIAINSIIWIVTALIVGGQMTELQRLNERMLDIESHYTYQLIETDPALLNELNYDKIRSQILDGEVIPIGTEDYRQWRRLYESFTEKSDQMVFNRFGFTPARFDFFKLFSSMFIHANFFHLLFNMLFLWLVGCNIEDDWSWKVFLGLYVFAGLVAGIFHGLAFPKSTIPLIGASGAIAGIMGAFMIRHFKTKVRFAYFFLFFIKPYYGVFSIYAGIALPIWFIQQILGASWGAESGTAYWAHIGGFVFGAAMGVSFKFLGVEKKYIEPMVEDSFEKLKMSPKMKEASRLLDMENLTDAIPLLRQVIDEEHLNHDAPLILARLYYENGNDDGARSMYEKTMDVALRTENDDLIFSIHDEVKAKQNLAWFSEKTLYRLANFYERSNKYEEAVQLYGMHIQIHQASPVRPKAIHRVHLLFRNHLKDEVMARNALAYLRKEYPGWLQP